MIRTALIAVSAIAVLSGHTSFHTALSPAKSGGASADFHWSGVIPAGGSLRIRNLAGDIEVRRATSGAADVSAAPEPMTSRWLWSGSDPVEPVSFVTRNSGPDVLVCAISTSVPDCSIDDVQTSRYGNWHPQPMRIVVRLPAGVAIQSRTMHGDLVIASTSAAAIAQTGHGNISITDVTGTVDASSGHGDVRIANATSLVKASTGHGDIDVSANGPVNASTGHGDIVVTLANAAAANGGDMSFSTGHGNVTVHAPRNLAGIVNITTGNGHVSTDFPLSMNQDGRYSRSESAHGTLGNGNRTLKLSSGHGDVTLTN